MKTSLFAYGFRSQFLLAGLAAITLIPFWAASFVTGLPTLSTWPPMLWHSHEMLFGFIISAVAGFMLTAVPSWTGQKGFAGRPLVALAMVWLIGRGCIASAALWPAWMPALADLAFLPLLAALIAQPLLRAHNRNTPLLAIIAVLWLANVTFHVAVLRHDAPLALQAVHFGINVVLVLTTVIGGRIVPAFTTSGLRPSGLTQGVANSVVLTRLAIGSMIAVLLGDLITPESQIAGGIAAVAAIIQLWRMLQWRTVRTLRLPILWVLHLGYAWIPVGLALKAGALIAGLGFAAFWLHSLTIGALSTLILAVMTRASLGHTGRALVVDPLVTLAYGLLTGATLMRVFGVSALGLSYPLIILWTALLWTASFGLFVWVYGPILLNPRVDGKPG